MYRRSHCESRCFWVALSTLTKFKDLKNIEKRSLALLIIKKMYPDKQYFIIQILQVQMDVPGPPPAYESVVEGPSNHKDCTYSLQVFFQYIYIYI